MSTYSEFIKNIKAFQYKDYSSVSSREKLVVYTMHYLQSNDVPLTFNYICIATFKLFPDKFYFSEEFKEFPHIEMLNRTILHLRPIERNYASGSVRENYQLTDLGVEIAKEVESILKTGKATKSTKTPSMDLHKKTPENDLRKLKSSQLFKTWQSSKKIDEMRVWEFFDVTPYTQINRIKDYIKINRVYAKDKGEAEVVELLDSVIGAIS